MARILLVEDDQFLSSILRDHLRLNGYEVECAFDGDMAVTRAIQNHFDLVLLDILLPQKDGFEVLTTLKSMSATQQIPVIVISNLSDQGSVERMKQGGAFSYLVKAHVTPDLVRDEIQKALGK